MKRSSFAIFGDLKQNDHGRVAVYRKIDFTNLAYNCRTEHYGIGQLLQSKGIDKLVIPYVDWYEALIW